jgi:Rrf2 family protein
MSANTRFPVAVHIMTALAYRDGESISSPLLAKSVRTNPVVIRRALRELRAKGLVEAQPGAGGGSRLTRRPESITLLDIFRAVGPLSPFSLPNKAEVKTCAVSCAMRKLLSSVLADTDRAIARSLEAVRLSDLVQRVGEAEKLPR